MTRRAEWEAGVSLFVNDENDEPLEYVSKAVYDRITGALQAKLAEQNAILAENITVDTWELWRGRA